VKGGHADDISMSKKGALYVPQVCNNSKFKERKKERRNCLFHFYSLIYK